ncbi:hypothetical protein C8R44DRAFT_983177 [Mycena epipterygia]|nr:hypothetical protein C8R44DRAFT_983177 [Mycena epipterygia]
MKISHALRTTTSSAVATLATMGHHVNDLLKARTNLVDLSYIISHLEGKIAELETAGANLLLKNNILQDHLAEMQEVGFELLQEKQGEIEELQAVGADLLEENDKLEVLTEHLALELDLQQATADQFEELASHEQVIIEAGILYVERLSEELYRTEARARDTHFLLMDDPDRKKDVIETQEEQIAKLHKKSDAANAHIATLEAKIVADGAKYRALLAHSQMIHIQTEQIASLTSTIHTLEHHAAVALAAHTANVARAKTDAKTIRKKARRIAEVEANIVRLEAREAQAEAKNVKDSEIVAEQAADIVDLKDRIKELEVEAVVVWAGERAEQKRLEERAHLAEQRVVFLEDEKISTADKTKATITKLAVLHAKELVAARTRNAADVDDNSIDFPATPATMIPETESTTTAPTTPIASSSSQDFSLNCQHHFSTRFVVRSDSAFAQASIAEPGHFVTDARKIVQRGGNSYVTPLLLPAWPECSGRVEDGRSPKRVKRI